MTTPIWTAEAIAQLAFAGFLLSTGNGDRSVLPEAAIAHREQLCQIICTQFCGNSKAEKAIAAIRQGEVAALTRLAVYLQDAMEDDSAFATTIRNLAQFTRSVQQNVDNWVEQTNRDQSKGYQTRVEGGKAYIADDLYIADNSTMSQLNAGSNVGSQAETVQGNVVNYNFFGTSPPSSHQLQQPSSNGSKLTPPHNIPRSDVTFVDRQLEVEQLHQLLQQYDVVVITNGEGLEGLGKTELAVQYSRKHLTDYPGGICWLYPKQLDLGTQLVGFVRGCFVDVEIPTTLTLADQLLRCWQKWREGQVLLVIDDVMDYEQIKFYLPSDSRFKLLLTAPSVAKLPMPRSQHLPLAGLPPDEALKLLTALLGEEVVNQETSFAAQLCAYVGYAPLGLHIIARCRKPEGVLC